MIRHGQEGGVDIFSLGVKNNREIVRLVMVQIDFIDMDFKWRNRDGFQPDTGFIHIIYGYGAVIGGINLNGQCKGPGAFEPVMLHGMGMLVQSQEYPGS